MLYILFIISAILLLIEAISELYKDDGKINVLFICIVLCILSIIGAYNTGSTYSFVLGIIFAVFYGLNLLGNLFTNNVLGFITSCAFMVLYIIGLTQI